MTRWMPSISKIGSFDIKAGKPYQFDGVKQGYQLFYDDLKCTLTDSNQEFICNGDRLNLVSGQLGNKAILDGMAVSRDGRQTGGRKFPKSQHPLFCILGLAQQLAEICFYIGIYIFLCFINCSI